MLRTTPKIKLKSALVLAALVLALAEIPQPAGAAEPARFTNSLGMEFVLIPAGSFMMGSPANEKGRGQDEAPHQVTITKPFYMQTTEVTLHQWRALMGHSMFGRRRGPGKSPVTKVSYFDALDYIQELNQKGEGAYSLPSEAQWEYAARAGTTTAYAFGPTINCGQAMFGNNPLKNDRCVEHYANLPRFRSDEPAHVGSFPPNAWGLFDMHGNVWEWCSDWYGPYPSGPASDPQGPSDGTHRVRRGGSWFRGVNALRSANRNFANPAAKYKTLGFRLVRQVQ